MKTEKFFQKMNDGTEIAVNRWMPEDEENSKALVIFCHGMLEHSLRYDRIGSIFAENGFMFSAHDQRGHGKTAQNAESNGTGCFGYLSDKNGFEKVTSDLLEIIDQAKEDFPGKKVILIGHSFGSFVCQNFIENYGNLIDACVLIGSSGRQKLAGIGRLITAAAKITGKKRRSKAIQNIAFSGYLKKIKNPKTSMDWLSASSENLKMYRNDDWCGGIATIGFFNDLSNGLCKIHATENIAKIPVKLPVLFAAGSDDPLGEYGKTIKNLIEEYAKNGMDNVQFNQYKGDRHEILFEKDSDQILEDILNWIVANV